MFNNLIAKIKAVLAARKLIKQANKEVLVDGEIKRGRNTSEFWGKSLMQAIVLYNAFAKNNINPELGIQLVVGLEAVYVAGRSVIKVAKELAGYFIKKQPAVVVAEAPVDTIIQR